VGVGLADGVGDGDGVGLAVGLGVGLGVGDGVGAATTSAGGCRTTALTTPIASTRPAARAIRKGRERWGSIQPIVQYPRSGASGTFPLY
jgi:hypothetical protein